MQRVQLNEYYYAVKEYFGDHKMPSRVYKFLLDTLQENEYKLSDDLFYSSIDTFETTEDCMCFCAGTECILLLCSEPVKSTFAGAPRSKLRGIQMKQRDCTE